MGKKFTTWIKAFRPPLILSVIGTLLFSGLSICMTTGLWKAFFGSLFPEIYEILSIIVYVCAAVFLTLGTWALVLFFKKSNPKQQFLDATGKNPFTARLTRDFKFRTMIITSGSLLFNVILSSSKMFAGWFYSSTWLMVLAGYYLILCLSRALLLSYGRRQTRLHDEHAVAIHEWKAYRLCGILLLFMTVFLQGVVIMIVRDGTGFSYNEIVVITIAAYDFYCLGNALFYMFAKRKNHSPIVNSLKMISFAASMVAILSLQTAMFSSFGAENEGSFKMLMNIFTGTVVCVILIVLGIVAIVRANGELKKMEG